MKINALFLLLSISILSIGFCHENIAIDVNDQVLEQLLMKGDSSILQNGPEGEIYLNEEKILPTRGGMLLETDDGDLYRLPFVISTDNGCCTFLNAPATIYPVIKCKGCERAFSPTIFNRGICPYCKTQN